MSRNDPSEARQRVEVSQLQRALNALRLEVPGDIVDYLQAAAKAEVQRAVDGERSRYAQLLNAVAGHSQAGGPEPCWCFASTGAGDCHDEPQCVAASEAVWEHDNINPFGELYEAIRARQRAAGSGR